LPAAAKRDANASRPDGARDDPRPANGQRFPRAVRLLHRAEFDAIYRDGRRRASKHFAVLVRPNGRGWSRFGSSVKRALGGAVVRNRIRRRIREILRLHLQEIAPGWDVVIHPRSSVATAAFTTLSQDLLGVLRATLQDVPPPRPAAR